MMPRFALLDDFLPVAMHDALLAHVMANRSRFSRASIHREGKHLYDDTLRTSLSLHDLGSLEGDLRSLLLAAAAGLADHCGIALPDPISLELELTAYGDGSHFGRHTDTSTGAKRARLGAEPGQDRLLSAVYYFHRLPRGFNGGALRLFAWGDDAVGEDIEAVDNRLLAFPSWADHQVTPVSCPSGAFDDYRFALNCWFCATVD